MTGEELDKLVKCGETSLVQYKEMFSTEKEIAADMVAFANQFCAIVRRAEAENVQEKEAGTTPKTTQKTTQKILEEIGKNSTISRNELAEMCGISTDGIKWHLKQMQEKGLIRRVGPDKGGHWEIIKNEEKGRIST